jgi:hypothetical protein
LNKISDPAGAISFTLHQPGAYDMLARTFGPGFDGPLELADALPKNGARPRRC